MKLVDLLEKQPEKRKVVVKFKSLPQACPQDKPEHEVPLDEDVAMENFQKAEAARLEAEEARNTLIEAKKGLDALDDDVDDVKSFITKLSEATQKLAKAEVKVAEQKVLLMKAKSEAERRAKRFWPEMFTSKTDTNSFNADAGTGARMLFYEILFHQADVDGNGYISYEDARQLLAFIAPDIDKESREVGARD